MPAVSSALTMSRTCSVVNWWRIAWLPSRRVESISRTFRSMVFLLYPALGRRLDQLAALLQQALGVHLADADRGGGLDVQVARVLGQVGAGALDLDEYRDAVVV